METKQKEKQENFNALVAKFQDKPLIRPKPNSVPQTALKDKSKGASSSLLVLAKEQQQSKQPTLTTPVINPSPEKTTQEKTTTLEVKKLNSSPPKMWNPRFQERGFLLNEVGNLPGKSRMVIKEWVQNSASAPKDEKSVKKILAESMDDFLRQPNRTQFPTKNYHKFINALPSAIQEEMRQLFNEKIEMRRLREKPNRTKLQGPPADPPATNCIAFFKHYPLSTILTVYSTVMGGSLGVAYLADPKATKDFVTTMPSGESVEKFFNNALAVYLTPMVIVALIAIIVTGCRYKNKDQQMYELLGTPSHQTNSS